ncbi:hypothetical protein SASPL_150622 [Salvia splendens]|uniref:Uncharacterized protein n=1 Tax=Salvia splendens TaxID=180675 RepID=A0A8X8W730_SALSN|nr:hypothetical protein SASPL_150622 [Salvia splendens]
MWAVGTSCGQFKVYVNVILVRKSSLVVENFKERHLSRMKLEEQESSMLHRHVYKDKKESQHVNETCVGMSIDPMHRSELALNISKSLFMSLYSIPDTYVYANLRIEIWVMKEYGDEKSWTKEFSILKENTPLWDGLEQLNPIDVLKNGDMLLSWRQGD